MIQTNPGNAINYQNIQNVPNTQNVPILTNIQNPLNFPNTQNLPNIQNPQNFQNGINAFNYQNNLKYHNTQNPITIQNENIPKVVQPSNFNNIQKFQDFQPIKLGNPTPPNYDFTNAQPYPIIGPIYKQNLLQKNYAQPINDHSKKIEQNRIIKNAYYKNQGQNMKNNHPYIQEKVDFIQNHGKKNNQNTNMILESTNLVENNIVIPSRNIEEGIIKNAVNQIEYRGNEKNPRKAVPILLTPTQPATIPKRKISELLLNQDEEKGEEISKNRVFENNTEKTNRQEIDELNKKMDTILLKINNTSATVTPLNPKTNGYFLGNNENNFEKEKIKEKIKQLENILSESYICPISKSIFEDPVLADDGQTYERNSINEWIKDNNKSPLTNEPFKSNELKTNYLIKSQIQGLRSKIDALKAQLKKYEDLS